VRQLDGAFSVTTTSDSGEINPLNFRLIKFRSWF